MTETSRTPIWLDVDTGHDDAFAILLAARHPSINLLGISTTYGNAPLPKTTYNTRAILKAIGREDVPVYPGAAKPFCRDVVHAPEIHGESGLDGTTCLPVPTVPERTERVATEGMYNALKGTERGSAWLIPTGALTNAALLFATHPDLVDHIGGMSIMGGAVGGGFTDAPMGAVDGEHEGERFGNITPYAEFNIYIDPESGKSILGSPVLAAKTTLIPLDLTHQFLGTEEVQRSLLHGFSSQVHCSSQPRSPPSKVRQLFLEILTFFAHTYAQTFNITAGPPLHDPLAVVAAFAPHLFSSTPAGSSGVEERFNVSVITEGAHNTSDVFVGDSQCGRTVVTPVPKGKGGGVRIPRAVREDEVWRMLEGCLERAERAVGSGG